MTSDEFQPSIGLHFKAISTIGSQAGNDEKHLILVRVHVESFGKVAAVVITRIEREPERLGVCDVS